jgi:GH25 family lysozyme M1 (1,4-beta-N-acetylmuramidase)
MGLAVVSSCIPPVPLPGPACWRIAPEVPLRDATDGETFLFQKVEIDYGGGSVLLSSSCDGLGQIWVDDAFLVTVTRPDGTTAGRTIDFSFDCQGHISTLEAADLTALFANGRNVVEVRLVDICGGHVGCTELYMVLEHGDVDELARVFGIDVNAKQGPVLDWAAALSNGYSFAYVKATEGDEDGKQFWNAYFEDQVKGARAAGLVVGVYHYAAPETNSPEDEAEYFVKLAGQYVHEGYLRPALDIEEVKGPTSTGVSLSEWIVRWIEAVREKTGVEALVYTDSDYANRMLEDWLADPTTGYELWLSQWKCSSRGSPDCGIWDDRWAFWQYWAPTEATINGCGHNTIPGIGADTDVDVFNGGMAKLRTYLIP